MFYPQPLYVAEAVEWGWLCNADCLRYFVTLGDCRDDIVTILTYIHSTYTELVTYWLQDTYNACQVCINIVWGNTVRDNNLIEITKVLEKHSAIQNETWILSQNPGCDERYQYIILHNHCKLTENLGPCCVVVTVVSDGPWFTAICWT